MIIIPARLASTRFKNKLLVEIAGVPIFIKTALNAALVDEVCIACDDEIFLQIAKKYEIKAILTSKEHNSGTDRINEAAQILGLSDDEIVVNLQADEPFFEPENLQKFVKFTKERVKNGDFMTSCFKEISKDEAQNPNLVKVVLDIFQNALYFSRSLLPYPRENCENYKGHIGIYGFSVRNLREFCKFQTSFLENIEKLEQLRALENGKKIALCQISTKSVGIDTKEDYLKASEIFGFLPALS